MNIYFVWLQRNLLYVFIFIFDEVRNNNICSLGRSVIQSVTLSINQIKL